MPEIVTKMIAATQMRTLNLLFPQIPSNLTTYSVATVITYLTRLMPVDTSKSLPEVISTMLSIFVPNNSTMMSESALTDLIPLDTTKTLPANILSMLPISFANVTSEPLVETVTALISQMLDTSMTMRDTTSLLSNLLLGTNTSADLNLNNFIKLLPVPLDTSKTLPETVDTIMQSLQLPANIVDNTASDDIDLLFSVPLDNSNMTLPDTIAGMLEMLPDDAADSPLSESISKLLPSSVRPITTLSELTAMMLAVLPSPFNASTDELPQIIEELLRVLPLPDDVHATQAKMIAAMLQTILPKEHLTLYDGVEALLPVFLGPQANDTMSMSLEQVLPLSINKTITESVEELSQLFSFAFNLSVGLDTPVPENLKALLQSMQLDIDTSLSDAVSEVLQLVLGNASNTSIGELLPVDLDQDLLMSLIPMLPLQYDSNNTLADVIHQILQVIPKPLSTNSMQETMGLVLGGILGANFSQNIMSESISELLPEPFNASQSLAGIITAMLPLLPVPLENLSIEDAMAEWLKVLPMDIEKTLAENLAGMYQQIPGFGDLSIPLLLGLGGQAIQQGLVLMPLRGDKVMESTFAGMLGLSRNDTLTIKLPIDANKTFAENIQAMMKMLPFRNSTLINATAAVLPLDPKKSISENIGEIVKALPLPKNLSNLDNLIPQNLTDDSLRSTAQNIVKLLSLPAGMNDAVTQLIHSMMKLLPKNETAPIVKAVSSTFNNFIKDPFKALSQSLGAIIPVDEDIPLEKLPQELAKMLLKNISTDVQMFRRLESRDAEEDMEQVLSLDPVRAVSNIVALMTGMAGLDMSKSLSELISSHAGLPAMFGAMLSVDTTDALISSLNLDASQALPHIMQQVMDTMMQCMDL